MCCETRCPALPNQRVPAQPSHREIGEHERSTLLVQRSHALVSSQWLFAQEIYIGCRRGHGRSTAVRREAVGMNELGPSRGVNLRAGCPSGVRPGDGALSAFEQELGGLGVDDLGGVNSRGVEPDCIAFIAHEDHGDAVAAKAKAAHPSATDRTWALDVEHSSPRHDSTHHTREDCYADGVRRYSQTRAASAPVCTASTSVTATWDCRA